MTRAFSAPGVRQRPNPPVGHLRLLGGWTQTGRGAGFAAHVEAHGPLPVDAFAGPSGRHRLIDLVDQSGLAGRGGAWFPTGRKLRSVAAGRKRAIVVANGCEGEPASEKDHALLNVAPHLVLDGVLLAAHAVDAVEAIVCVHRGDRLAAKLDAAVAQRRRDPMGIRVVEVPARYASSEASSLVNFLNTGDARPTSKPPRVSERGFRGRPTLVDNVETLAHLALLARYGSEWFRQVGTQDAPGTALMTVSGAVHRPGVYEIAVGTPLGQALGAAGGPQGPLQAVLLGGYGGTWLSLPAALRLPLTPQATREAGAALGVGLAIALPQRACGLAETARLLRYLAEESARQCGPCMFGLPAIAEDFTLLARGPGQRSEVVRRLRRRLEVITGRGACAHPDGAVRMAASALRVFGQDVNAHLRGQPCPFGAARSWLPLPSANANDGTWR